MQHPHSFWYHIIMLHCAIVALILSFPVKVEGGTSRCAVVTEHDARMMCFAIATNNSSYCAFIKDVAERNKCYIIVKGG